MSIMVEAEHEKAVVAAKLIFDVANDLLDQQYGDMRWVAMGCQAYAASILTEVEFESLMEKSLNTPEALMTLASNLLITGFLSGMKLQSSFVSLH